jgi:effector-binding domain-containing protein
MLDTPKIIHTTPQTIAVIHITVPVNQIREVMGPGITELRDAVAAQGIAITGAWFTHHLRMPGEIFDFEIGLPVAKEVTAAGRTQPGVWPAMKLARVIYHGPYEGLPSAWGEFGKWIAANTHQPAAELWEQYVSGPESGNDPAAWRTELNRPLL